MCCISPGVSHNNTKKQEINVSSRKTLDFTEISKLVVLEAVQLFLFSFLNVNIKHIIISLFSPIIKHLISPVFLIVQSKYE